MKRSQVVVFLTDTFHHKIACTMYPRRFHDRSTFGSEVVNDTQKPRTAFLFLRLGRNPKLVTVKWRRKKEQHTKANLQREGIINVTVALLTEKAQCVWILSSLLLPRCKLELKNHIALQNWLWMITVTTGRTKIVRGVNSHTRTLDDIYQSTRDCIYTPGTSQCNLVGHVNQWWNFRTTKNISLFPSSISQFRLIKRQIRCSESMPFM